MSNRLTFSSDLGTCCPPGHQVLGKVIDIRLKSPGWIRSLEEEMSVDRICGAIPTSASSTLLAEDTDMGDDDYDMEGELGALGWGAGAQTRRTVPGSGLLYLGGDSLHTEGPRPLDALKSCVLAQSRSRFVGGSMVVLLL